MPFELTWTKTKALQRGEEFYYFKHPRSGHVLPTRDDRSTSSDPSPASDPLRNKHVSPDLELQQIWEVQHESTVWFTRQLALPLCVATFLAGLSLASWIQFRSTFAAPIATTGAMVLLGLALAVYSQHMVGVHQETM
jgi:hypothetical protein